MKRLLTRLPSAPLLAPIGPIGRLAAVLALGGGGGGGGAPVSYGSLITGLNPKAYWPLNETAGTTLTDAVGSSSGSYGSGVTLNQAGPVATGDPGVAFNGTGTHTGYVRPALSQFTLTCWLKGDTSVGGRIFADGHPDSDALGFQVYQDKWDIGPGSTDTLAWSAPNDGAWHSVAFRYDSIAGRMSVWIDGTNSFSQSVTGNMVAGETGLGIAYNPVYNGDQWPGQISDVAVWETALTDAQLVELAVLGTLPVTGIDTTFNGGSWTGLGGQTAVDGGGSHDGVKVTTSDGDYIFIVKQAVAAGTAKGTIKLHIQTPANGVRSIGLDLGNIQANDTAAATGTGYWGTGYPDYGSWSAAGSPQGPATVDIELDYTTPVDCAGIKAIEIQALGLNSFIYTLGTPTYRVAK